MREEDHCVGRRRLPHGTVTDPHLSVTPLYRGLQTCSVCIRVSVCTVLSLHFPEQTLVYHSSSYFPPLSKTRPRGHLSSPGRRTHSSQSKRIKLTKSLLVRLSTGPCVDSLSPPTLTTLVSNSTTCSDLPPLFTLSILLSSDPSRPVVRSVSLTVSFSPFRPSHGPSVHTGSRPSP